MKLNAKVLQLPIVPTQQSVAKLPTNNKSLPNNQQKVFKKSSSQRFIKTKYHLISSFEPSFQYFFRRYPKG